MLGRLSSQNRCRSMTHPLTESERSPCMKYGDRIIIDRKTGEILQMEKITQAGLERGIRIMAKVLVDSLLREAEKGATV